MMSLAATATVVLMLILLSGLVIVVTALNAGLQFIEEKVAVTARLRDDVDPAALEPMLLEIAGESGVASVTYVSPDEALERLRETYRERGEVLDTGGADIELYASLEVELSDPRLSDDVADALAVRPEVERITTRQSEYDRLLEVINLVRTVGLVAIGLVGITVLFMIVNTIRIALHSRSNEIEIMRLVGASDSFIRWPFIVEGVLCGVIGAAIALGLVALAWGPMQPVLTEFKVPEETAAGFLGLLAILLLSVGFTVGAVGSYISVRSYLSAAR